MQSWQNLVYVLHLPLQIPLYTQDCFKLFKMSCAYRSRAYLHIRHLSSLPYKNQNNYYKNPPKYDLSLDEKGNNITPLILWNEKGWEPIFQTQKYTCGKQLLPFAEDSDSVNVMSGCLWICGKLVWRSFVEMVSFQLLCIIMMRISVSRKLIPRDILKPTANLLDHGNNKLLLQMLYGGWTTLQIPWPTKIKQDYIF